MTYFQFNLNANFSVEKSRKIAARWVSGASVVAYSILRYANITFYAAPKWFCFDRYEIKLTTDHGRVVNKFTVFENELYKNGSNWMGQVIVDNLQPNMDYSIQVSQPCIRFPTYERRNFVKMCYFRTVSHNAKSVLNLKAYFRSFGKSVKFGFGFEKISEKN